MITLNTEKGLERIESWSTITDRPDYRPHIDPQASPMKEVIGGYEFDEPVNCGLPCNQPHKKGFLVATRDGLVTNIGKDCGKKYFGLDFEHARVSYERERTRFEHREVIRHLKNRLPVLRKEVEVLKDDEGNWVHKKSSALVDPTKGLPQIINQRIRELLRTGNRSIVEIVPVSPEEQRSREAQAGRKLPPQFEEKNLGAIRGLAFFSPENDLRQLFNDLLSLFDHVETFNEDTATDQALADLSKKAGAVDLSIENVRRSIVLGKELLTRSNLRVLSKLLRQATDSKAFISYLTSLPE